MAENLNYNVSGSMCYDNDPANCTKYGRLYDWATAMGFASSCNSTNCSSGMTHQGICPSGWHIPSNVEWDKLMRYVDGSTGASSPYESPTAGRYLKATSGWNSNNGQDTYGFSALPGGYGSSGVDFYNAGSGGYWWSSSEYEGSVAYLRIMHHYFAYAGYSHYYKGNLLSVRCLQD
jgi:uncharacterized protein (TIGR02145 family)